MKAKTKITEKDYVNAMRKANRELEIAMFGKQVSMRGGVKHKSKKAYDRNRMKRVPFV
jgi:RNase P protein component